MYQLSCKRPHDAFVGFDNWPSCGGAQSNRFSVVFTIRKLGLRENRVVSGLVSAMHGPEALGLRSGETSTSLEYMKYVLVYCGGSLSSIYDLDAACMVRPPTNKGLRRALRESCMVPFTSSACRGSVKSLLAPSVESEVATPEPLKYGAPVHHGAVPVTQKQVVYDTATHGKITLVLSRYSDPDIRNGLSIKVSRNLSKSTCWGALVTASDPKDVMLKRMTDIPAKLTPSRAEEVNSGSAYVKKTLAGKYDGVVTEATEMMVLKSRVARIRNHPAMWTETEESCDESCASAAPAPAASTDGSMDPAMTSSCGNAGTSQ